MARKKCWRAKKNTTQTFFPICLFCLTTLIENHHVCLILLRAALPECEVLRQLHEIVDQLHHPLEVIPKGILGGR